MPCIEKIMKYYLSPDMTDMRLSYWYGYIPTPRIILPCIVKSSEKVWRCIDDNKDFKTMNVVLEDFAEMLRTTLDNQRELELTNSEVDIFNEFLIKILTILYPEVAKTP